MAVEAVDVCLRVLKESNKSRFYSYSVRNSVLIISHITFRDCRLHIFPTTFLEIAVYTGTEDLPGQNAAIFWDKGLYLVGESCFFTVHTSLLSISSVFKKLHNTMIEWLNDTNVELVPNDLSLSP